MIQWATDLDEIDFILDDVTVISPPPIPEVTSDPWNILMAAQSWAERRAIAAFFNGDPHDR